MQRRHPRMTPPGVVTGCTEPASIPHSPDTRAAPSRWTCVQRSAVDTVPTGQRFGRNWRPSRDRPTGRLGRAPRAVRRFTHTCHPSPRPPDGRTARRPVSTVHIRVPQSHGGGTTTNLNILPTLKCSHFNIHRQGIFYKENNMRTETTTTLCAPAAHHRIAPHTRSQRPSP